MRKISRFSINFIKDVKMISTHNVRTICISLFLMVFCFQVFASSKAELQALVPEVHAIASKSDIVASVAAANQSHATLSAKDIRVLGREWHQGLVGKNSQILTQVNSSDLSAKLKSIQAQSNGKYLGIVVTDAKGLVVGQTYNAKHYSEAHRTIWSKIDKDGVKATYLSKPKKTSSGAEAILGLPITEANKVIGAILVSVPVALKADQSVKTH